MNAELFGTVISPVQRKPKNARQQAAHSITPSGSDSDDSEAALLFLIMLDKI